MSSNKGELNKEEIPYLKKKKLIPCIAMKMHGDICTVSVVNSFSLYIYVYISKYRCIFIVKK